MCLAFCLFWLCVLDGSRGLLQRLVHDLILNKINKMVAYSIYPLLYIVEVP
jgi:hypothetical protein